MRHRGRGEGVGGLPWDTAETYPQRRRRGDGVPGANSALSLLGRLPRGHPFHSMRTKLSHGISFQWGLGRDGIAELCPQLTPDLSPDVGGPADPIAPTIIIPPKNTSVVAGTSEVTMECVANARWVVPTPPPLHS